MNYIKNLIANISLTAWLALSVIAFAFVNRISYIHLFAFPNWEVLRTKASQISYFAFTGDALLACGGAITFGVICTGIGLLLLRPIDTSETSPLALGASAFVLGEIIFSVLFLSIISLTSLNPTTTKTILLASALIGLIPLQNFIAMHNQNIQKLNLEKAQKSIAILSICILLSSLLLTSSRLGYDAVSDYFSQAKLMATTGEASSFFPGNKMIVSSLHLDILFTILMQTFGDQSARALSWLNGIIILIIGYALGKEFDLSPQSKLYFLILMLSSTAYVDLFGDGKVELISTAPIMVAIYWMTLNTKSFNRYVFVLIGALIGFSIISRLYNIFLVSLFVVSFYSYDLFNETGKEQKNTSARIWKTIQPPLWILPSLILVGIFHLWQNWLWLGSPLAPLEFTQNLKASNWEWQFDPKMLNALRIFYPITVTFLNSPQSLGTISPVFVGFLPFLLIKEIRKKLLFSKKMRRVLMAGFITLAIWVSSFYTVVEIRYVMFIWFLLFLGISPLIEHSVTSGHKIISVTLQLLAHLLLIFMVIRGIYISIVTYSPILEGGQAACSDIKACVFFNSVNQLAKPGDRVFALNAYRYYFRNDLFDCSSRANVYSHLQELASKDPQLFWVELYRQGYHFIVYEENFSVYHSKFGTIPSLNTAPKWLKITILSSTGDNISYQIKSISPPFEPEISCARNSDGWYLSSSNHE
ncbi:MAG: hypothetical protein IT310_10525 [Anaerolineales bacterium]|nr:hypothetical protein [Anaerolineales bacterium]